MDTIKSWLNISNLFLFLRKKRGFSLVEMLVVVSITVLLSSLALSYNRSSEGQLRLYRDQATIVSILNRAKSLSLQRFNGSAEGSTVCGVGLKFPDSSDNKTFILFQDTEENCENSDNEYDEGETIEEFTIGDRISFVNPNGSEILFIPPHLDVVTTESDFPVNITLQLEGGNSQQAQVSVSAAGQITTQEIE